MKKTLFCVSLLVASSLPFSATADIILWDSFEVGGDAENGQYTANQNLNAAENADVSGGSIVGFSSDNAWDTGGSALPQIVGSGLSSSAVTGSGGAVSMRAHANDNDRVATRRIDSYTMPSSLYFSGTLSISLLDDDALALMAFSQAKSTAGQFALNIMGNVNNPLGYNFDGLAFGFKGDEDGGMDLVLRYRGADNVYTDSLLMAGITVDTAYTVAGAINWNPSGADEIIVGVNGEPIGTFSGALDTIGDPIDTVGFMHRAFGSGLSDTVTMDEIRLASTAEDLGVVIPEPGMTGLLIFGFGSAGLTFLRRTVSR